MGQYSLGDPSTVLDRRFFFYVFFVGYSYHNTTIGKTRAGSAQLPLIVVISVICLNQTLPGKMSAGIVR